MKRLQLRAAAQARAAVALATQVRAAKTTGSLSILKAARMGPPSCYLARMPHIRVELSGNVARPGRLKPFLSVLAHALAQFETIEPKAVKAYLNVREHFAMNPEGPPGFAHLEVSLMRGRQLELRRRIAEEMRRLVAEEFDEKVAAGEIAITVEIREMDPETYLR